MRLKLGLTDLISGVAAQHEHSQEAECNGYLIARSCVRHPLYCCSVAALTTSSSLAAAIVRLIVQEEISGGGYAAHTDVNRELNHSPCPR